ncbi:hypothetical protein GCM10010358_65960 [Streptomyces minutiscleroticus]|uniref:Uncharacterized protein n=1 Tax=Streptomyces minutiscleroticus TaxID=68238 RepID=A0A918NXJ9_9ACTN|nr:hypothetical protein GCM10010358_65960 [Streptomyces minutiscleroticus]
MRYPERVSPDSHYDGYGRQVSGRVPGTTGPRHGRAELMPPSKEISPPWTAPAAWETSRLTVAAASPGSLARSAGIPAARSGESARHRRTGTAVEPVTSAVLEVLMPATLRPSPRSNQTEPCLVFA